MMWIMRSIRRPFVQFHAANFSSSAAAVEAERCIREGARNDWKREEVKSIYDSPILDLLFHAVSYLHFVFPYKLSSFSTFRLIDSFTVLLQFCRLKFIDMLTILGKCSNARFYQLKLVDAAKTVRIARSRPDTTPASKHKSL